MEGIPISDIYGISTGVGPALISGSGFPLLLILTCALAAEKGEVAAHVQLFLLISMGVPSTNT